MRLQRLTALERDKILEEFKAIKKLIGELRKILGDDKLVYEIIESELAETVDLGLELLQVAGRGAVLIRHVIIGMKRGNMPGDFR